MIFAPAAFETSLRRALNFGLPLAGAAGPVRDVRACTEAPLA